MSTDASYFQACITNATMIDCACRVHHWSKCCLRQPSLRCQAVRIRSDRDLSGGKTSIRRAQASDDNLSIRGSGSAGSAKRLIIARVEDTGADTENVYERSEEPC